MIGVTIEMGRATTGLVDESANDGRHGLGALPFIELVD